MREIPPGPRSTDRAGASPPPAPPGGRSAASADDRLIAISRLLLAGSGLAIIWLIPEQPDRFVAGTYAALIIYTAYSAGLLALVRSPQPLARFFMNWGHWLDVVCYTILITLSSGTNSTYFFGYFFCILVASFRWGFLSGMRVTITSALLFTVFGYLSGPPPSEFELQRYAIRPIYLLVLGYLVASWGEHEIKLRRRLQFLKEVSTVSNPRFGVDQTVASLMQRLIRLYDVDACTMLTMDAASSRAMMRRVRREDAEQPARAEPLPDPVATHFLALPETLAAASGGSREARLWLLEGERLVKVAPGDPRAAVSPQTWDFLSSTLEAAAILTVPLFFQNRTSGRMLLASRRPRVFEEDDAVFLLQVMEHALPLIDHIRLVDQLASDAAREERRKLARDIHDGVIQPYVGLQMGLAGLANRLRSGEGDLDAEIRKLIEFTNSGIADLRRQVASLREGGTDGGSLRPAVFRFAERFTEATGIRVELDAPPSLPVSDRLAGEIFQMIAEGLSNIRRHTRSSQAKVHLSCARGMLSLRIENETANGAGSFTPSSIAERTAALGGRLWVDRREDGGTVVAVEIPL